MYMTKCHFGHLRTCGNLFSLPHKVGGKVPGFTQVIRLVSQCPFPAEPSLSITYMYCRDDKMTNMYRRYVSYNMNFIPYFTCNVIIYNISQKVIVQTHISK